MAAAGCVLGSLAAHRLAALPEPSFCLVAIVAGAFGCVLARSAWPLWPIVALVWTTLVAGDRLAARVPLAADGSDWRIAGWVDEIPIASPERVVLSLRTEPDSTWPRRRLRVSWYNPPTAVAAGDRVDVTVRLRHPRGYSNPDAFDYERWLFVEGYAATGYVRASHTAPVPHPSIAARMLRLRAALADRVRARVDDPAAAAIMAALALGERSGISEELWTVFRRTGTSHLVAISGLHISLISAAAFFIVVRAARRMPAVISGRDLECGLLAALAGGSAYAALAGFALPTQRAAIMVAFAALVVLSRRRVGALNGLAVATICVLALDPIAPLSASFAMSFAAVGVLLVCVLPRRGAIHHPALGSSMRSRIVQAGTIQCQLSLALVPLSAAWFDGVSVLAIPVNLLAIPLFCFALIPLTLLAVLGLAVAPSIGWLVDVAGGANAWAAAALSYVSSMPTALIETPPVRLPAFAIACAGVVLALPWHRAPGRRLAWLALVPLFVTRSPSLETGQADVLTLDVGHGLAIIVTTRSHRLVYDAGPLFRSGFDAGAEILVPSLRRDPGRSVDLIVISHADSDHRGGLEALRRAYPDAAILHGPDLEADRGSACVAGQRWEWDGVQFEIVHPDAAFALRGNESSCVLRVETAGARLLITGDIERRAETALLRRADLDVDVVVVPHHGSATSSSAGFVALTSPEIAIVSAAYGNQWGFPVAAVRRRWRDAGAALYITGESGAIELRLGSGITASPGLQRERERRYWHAPQVLPGETRPGTL